MKTATGTYRNGKVELDRTVDWREGTRVKVAFEEDPLGIADEDWPTTPEGIHELLARMDALEPLEFTPEEEVGIAARAASSG